MSESGVTSGAESAAAASRGGECCQGEDRCGGGGWDWACPEQGLVAVGFAVEAEAGDVGDGVVAPEGAGLGGCELGGEE